jgi:hypothetical protein
VSRSYPALGWVAITPAQQVITNPVDRQAEADDLATAGQRT